MEGTPDLPSDSFSGDDAAVPLGPLTAGTPATVETSGSASGPMISVPQEMTFSSEFSARAEFQLNAPIG